MSDNVMMVVEANVNAGQADNLKALLREMFDTMLSGFVPLQST